MKNWPDWEVSVRGQHRRFTTLVVLFLMASLATSCGDDQPSPDNGGIGSPDTTTPQPTTAAPATIEFLIGFFPTGNTSVFFLARDMGFFEQENLTVNITNVIGDTTVLQAVVAGQADIGYADYATMAVARAKEGVDLVGFMGVSQQSAMGIVSPTDSGIVAPADLPGKTLLDFAGSSTQIVWPVFLQQNGLSLDDVTVELVDPAARLSLVTEGRADGAIGFFVNNGPDLAAQCECEVDVMEWRNYGITSLSNGLVASSSYIGQNADVAQRFVLAVARAIEVQAQDPPGAAEFLIQNTPELMDFDIENLTMQIENFNAITRSAAGGGDPIGFMTDTDWQETVDLMVRSGQLDSAPEDLNQFYTNEFVEE
jgi:NitT/TauT family transport system substrate-binding protein